MKLQKSTLSIMLSASVFAAGTATAGELTFTSWGGSYQDAQEKLAVKPFTEKTGTKIKIDTYNGGIAQIRGQVQTKNVTWDVVDMQLSDIIRACDEGLLEKIDPAKDLAAGPNGVSPKNDFLPGGLNTCMAGNISWSTSLAYNKSKLAKAPTKVADFFDLKNFPGKRALRKSPEGALEWALIADGVPANQVYKTLLTSNGVERAFKKLDTIKSSIVWWEAGAQPPQLLSDGEVVMTSAYNNRIYSAITKDNKPFEFLWDGQLQNVEGFAIVKGSKNLAEAKAFIKAATTPEALAVFANETAYGPIRKSSLPLLDKKIAKYLPTAPQNQKGALAVDTLFWADNGDALNQKFAVWLGRK
ncbi:ABC transporter substrate-binding protein [Leeia sp. TBRC 13508]|uniref:ABC transporter substrate-binding protein n=1 Tax=Leeia speluncae TaxID=2884804 RepID=A0ABS8D9T7_9NEIS|nr:ABC transporter substrate-binding protein [Leeia speluncae]MCB6184980.1 ABC transporter substrate-binding protein [Leeia speluncae]